MLKDFDKWNQKKKDIDKLTSFLHPNVGEVWWIKLGLNVGSEINGKEDNFLRPVLVINNDNHESCFVLPLTSKIKKGRYRCSIKTDDNLIHDVLILKGREVDKRRFVKRKYKKINEKDYLKVKKLFNENLFK